MKRGTGKRRFGGFIVRIKTPDSPVKEYEQQGERLIEKDKLKAAEQKTKG